MVKSVSMNRSTPLFDLEQEDIISAPIETLPLQLSRSNGRASVSNEKRKSHRPMGPTARPRAYGSLFFSFFCMSYNAFVCE